MDDDLLLKIPEAARKAKSSRSTVYDAIKRKQLRAVKRGRLTFIRPDDLRAWVDALPALEPRGQHLK